MSYRDLQVRAKELGLKYIGVSTADLEKSIKEAEDKQSPEEDNSPEVKETPKNENANAAVIKDGNNEVRRYSLNTHGEDFEKLAENFAEKKGYTVEFVEVKPGIRCPSCGHIFYPEA